MRQITNSRRRLANSVRVLSMDAVEKAKSGHPGAPMGMADIAQVLWGDVLRHNPANPDWFNRDRFVLSNGHGSMLLYSLLHLTGYDLSIEDLKSFRQLHSKTPGHPEYGDTPGVETTTGPLGQGLANGVGMAIAERMLAAQFNRSQGGVDYNVVDHSTYVFLGDGCLMEGVSHEAASLAGTLKLGKLICFYDDNGISIDGEIDGWFTDDTPARFEAYGWQVLRDVDGHDSKAIFEAVHNARANTDTPTLICCKTRIGYGAPSKGGTAASHGSPLGADEVRDTRITLGWELDPFDIPADVYEDWNAVESGTALENEWRQAFAEYAQAFPELAVELERRIDGTVPEGFDDAMQALLEATQVAGPSKASRSASGDVIEKLHDLLPELVGGSADLSGSNCTMAPNARPLTATDASGNYIYYGVREFGMNAITNGIALHGGLLPFNGTFLVFMEYGRNALRMASLMGLRAVFVYTHDSIGQGEDGPTHQPVEQLTNLRTTPNLSTWRPCDAVETVAAWHAAVKRSDGPTALVFSRQSLPHQARDGDQLANIARGAYVLREPAAAPDVVLLATGSEVGLVMDAAERLAAAGTQVRVVSMPSADVFGAQDAAYRDGVLPPGVPRVAVEAAHGDWWYKWVGLDGGIVSLDRFGLSAPGPVAMETLGFTPDNVVQTVRRVLG